MTKAAKRGKTDGAVLVEQRPGQSPGAALAGVLLSPHLRHGHTASTFADPLLGTTTPKPTATEYAEYVKARGDEAERGQLEAASHMLAAQAVTLDAMFTEFARRAALNMGEFIGASERYARLAMKAQGNCRAALETLAKLHQPREQTVRHVHVNEGGQAIVAGEFHNHTGARENDDSTDQSHAPETHGSAGSGTALPSPDAGGDGVPIASSERETALQDARRD